MDCAWICCKNNRNRRRSAKSKVFFRAPALKRIYFQIASSFFRLPGIVIQSA